MPQLPLKGIPRYRYRDNRNVLFLALDSGTGGDAPDLARAYVVFLIDGSGLADYKRLPCMGAAGILLYCVHFCRN